MFRRVEKQKPDNVTFNLEIDDIIYDLRDFNKNIVNKNVVLTVASRDNPDKDNFDFPDFQTALDSYFDDLNIRYGSNVILSLEDGIHELSKARVKEEDIIDGLFYPSITFDNLRLTITGTENATIVFTETFFVKKYAPIFYSINSDIAFKYLTLDFRNSSFDLVDDYYLTFSFLNSTVLIDNVKILGNESNNNLGILSSGSGTFVFIDSTIEDCKHGIGTFTRTSISLFGDCVFRNIDKALLAFEDGVIIYNKYANLIFDNVTTEYFVTTRLGDNYHRIYDTNVLGVTGGGIIDTKELPTSFLASGSSDSKPVYDAKNSSNITYIDEELGIPVFWINGNWCKADGTLAYE